jgi:Eukaryotic cytochrome b561
MIDWLLSPIDPVRLHVVSESMAWHGRAMTLAWGILVPLGVLAARFFKVLPWQNWPMELDHNAWWLTHRIFHYLAGLLTILGLVLIFQGKTAFGSAGMHAWFGWAVVFLALGQFLSGWLRGSKGGPTDPQPDGSLSGDHYDMTKRRIIFEYVHKFGGYLALALALSAMLTGLWRANAPHWMWLVLALWWTGLLIIGAFLQHKGRAVDTYQAIWGPDDIHPGNARRPIGIGITRRKD